MKNCSHIFSVVLAAAGFSFFISTDSFAQTTSRPCPFSCQSAGYSDNECRDFREGNTCTIVVSQGSNAGAAGGQNVRRRRGQKLCIAEDGALITRRNCRARRGETEADIPTLSTLIDTTVSGIPGGETVHGVVGHLTEGVVDTTYSSTSSLGGEASQTLLDADVMMAQSAALSQSCAGDATACLGALEIATSQECEGTASAPTAPVGKICVYASEVTNATNLRAEPLPGTGGLYGFVLRWDAVATGPTGVHAVWAYTKPLPDDDDNDDDATDDDAAAGADDADDDDDLAGSPSPTASPAL